MQFLPEHDLQELDDLINNLECITYESKKTLQTLDDYVPSFCGCAHCVTCNPGCQHGLQSSYLPGSSANPAQWWPGQLQSPTVYFLLGERKLQYLLSHPSKDSSPWRASSQALPFAPSLLLITRHHSPLSILIPSACTNISQQESTVQYSRTVVMRITKPFSGSPSLTPACPAHQWGMDCRDDGRPLPGVCPNASRERGRWDSSEGKVSWQSPPLLQASPCQGIKGDSVTWGGAFLQQTYLGLTKPHCRAQAAQQAALRYQQHEEWGDDQAPTAGPQAQRVQQSAQQEGWALVCALAQVVLDYPKMGGKVQHPLAECGCWEALHGYLWRLDCLPHAAATEPGTAVSKGCGLQGLEGGESLRVWLGGGMEGSARRSGEGDGSLPTQLRWEGQGVAGVKRKLR